MNLEDWFAQTHRRDDIDETGQDDVDDVEY
jgi:hypothetical protein